MSTARVVKSVLHGQKGEGNPPPFSLFYMEVDPHRIKAVVKSSLFGVLQGTRPIKPVYISTQVTDFYNNLTKSIEEKGFLNPILCWNFADGLHVLYGTSRACIAAQLNKPIPAFIVDFADTWQEGQPIVTEQEALSKFGEIPEEWIWENDYFNFVNSRFPWDPVVVKHNGKPAVPTAP